MVCCMCHPYLDEPQMMSQVKQLQCPAADFQLIMIALDLRASAKC